MTERREQIKKIQALRAVKDILSRRTLPFFTAILTVGCYYLGAELVTIWYLSLTSVAMLLLLDDLSPLISNFLFMAITISYQHSPQVVPGAAAGLSNFLFQPAVLVQLILAIALVVAAVFARIAMTAVRGKFKPTPVFFGLCALSAAFLLNGVFSEGYSPANLVYGLFMAFFFLGIFAVMKDNLSCTRETFENVAVAFVALSCALVLELAMMYLTYDDLIVDGAIYRDSIIFGWGMRNTMGMLLLLTIPSIFYLAGRCARGWLLYLYSAVVLAATFFTTSRQAMVGAAVIYPLCLVILLVKGRNRKTNLIITGVAALILLAAVCLLWQKISGMFSSLMEGLMTGSGRLDLWQTAWQNFLSSPLCGTGFYVDLEHDYHAVGLDIVPKMYHNTIMQLLGACGALGLAAYLVHRAQTVISYCKNVNTDRTLLAVTLLALLLVNLLDNHLFYMLPTLIYSSLTAMLVQSQNVFPQRQEQLY